MKKRRKTVTDKTLREFARKAATLGLLGGGDARSLVHWLKAEREQARALRRELRLARTSAKLQHKEIQRWHDEFLDECERARKWQERAFLHEQWAKCSAPRVRAELEAIPGVLAVRLVEDTARMCVEGRAYVACDLPDAAILEVAAGVAYTVERELAAGVGWQVTVFKAGTTLPAGEFTTREGKVVRGRYEEVTP